MKNIKYNTKFYTISNNDIDSMHESSMKEKQYEDFIYAFGMLRAKAELGGKVLVNAVEDLFNLMNSKKVLIPTFQDKTLLDRYLCLLKKEKSCRSLMHTLCLEEINDLRSFIEYKNTDVIHNIENYELIPKSLDSQYSSHLVPIFSSSEGLYDFIIIENNDFNLIKIFDIGRTLFQTKGEPLYKISSTFTGSSITANTDVLDKFIKAMMKSPAIIDAIKKSDDVFIESFDTNPRNNDGYSCKTKFTFDDISFKDLFYNFIDSFNSLHSYALEVELNKLSLKNVARQDFLNLINKRFSKNALYKAKQLFDFYNNYESNSSNKSHECNNFLIMHKSLLITTNDYIFDSKICEDDIIAVLFGSIDLIDTMTVNKAAQLSIIFMGLMNIPNISMLQSSLFELACIKLFYRMNKEIVISDFVYTVSNVILIRIKESFKKSNPESIDKMFKLENSLKYDSQLMLLFLENKVLSNNIKTRYANIDNKYYCNKDDSVLISNIFLFDKSLNPFLKNEEDKESFTEAFTNVEIIDTVISQISSLFHYNKVKSFSSKSTIKNINYVTYVYDTDMYYKDVIEKFKLEYDSLKEMFKDFDKIIYGFYDLHKYSYNANIFNINKYCTFQFKYNIDKAEDILQCVQFNGKKYSIFNCHKDYSIVLSDTIINNTVLDDSFAYDLVDKIFQTFLDAYSNDELHTITEKMSPFFERDKSYFIPFDLSSFETTHDVIVNKVDPDNDESSKELVELIKKSIETLLANSNFGVRFHNSVRTARDFYLMNYFGIE